jgi:hypothetical protein
VRAAGDLVEAPMPREMTVGYIGHGTKRDEMSSGHRPPRGYDHKAMHKFLVIFTALQFVVGTAMAQPTSESAASKDNILSLDQKLRIAEIITKRSPALAGANFHVAIEGIVPKEIDLQSLPSNAEDVAPELRGFGYIVVEELIAIVEKPTRKIVVVFPRWGEQQNK